MKTIYLPEFGNVPLTLDDGRVHIAFTQGYCAALALALNHITDCKMVKSWCHAAVISFDGRVLDIEGVHNPTKFERKWGRVEPCDERKLDEDFYNVEHWRKALPFAKLLVKKYLH